MAPHSLILANHISWLDIPILAATTGCAFVAKSELRSHPLIRWLCDQNHTIYVDRDDRQGIQRQAKSMRQALEGRQPLALFPEGTVGREGRLLPFRPSLLSVVAPPPMGVNVHPVAVDYGLARSGLSWPAGESGIANAIRVLGRRGRFAVTVTILPALDTVSDRKLLARTAHDAIASALGATSV